MSIQMNVLTTVMTVLSFGIVSVDALALGSAPIPGQPGGSPTSTYNTGYGLGQRNGTLIAQRLFERTVKLKGCSQLDAYQAGLLNVNRSVRPPNLNGQTDQNLVRGFFKGYLDSVRKAIQTSRSGCKKVKFDNGAFPGQFYGSLLCQAVRVNVDLVQALEVVPLYNGWSGGFIDRSRECETAGTIEIRTCGFPNATPLPSTVVASLRTACSI